MCASNNLWANVVKSDGGYEDTSKVIPFFLEQASGLGEATDGKVTAVFDRTEKVINPSSVGALLSSALASSGLAPSPFLDNVSQPLDDANSLYFENHYAFEIRSNRYRFRLLSLTVRPLFPVEMRVDEGVHDDVEDLLRGVAEREDGTTNITIHSFSDMTRCFEVLLGSKKLGYLVRSLMTSGVKEEPAED